MNEWTKERHETAKARCEAATEGPWDVEEGGAPNHERQMVSLAGSTISPLWIASFGMIQGETDAPFAAHAREDLPDALNHIKAQDDAIRELVDCLEYIKSAVGWCMVRETARRVEAALEKARTFRPAEGGVTK